METIFIFIAKSSALILMFYLAYYFLLRKETFFNSNRWFLLAGLVTSVVLPLLVYTKVIWVDPTPLPSAMNYSMAYYGPQTNAEETFEINWNWVSLTIYTLGFLAFMIRFVMDFYSLNVVLKGKKIEQQADFKFVDIKENIAPFSYFDYIVYNSSMYTPSELENILEHEKVHSDQNHTVDVLISRLFCVLFWFNPIIWMYKKAIMQNLEFIADCEATKKISDKKAYQYTLLKITTHESCVAITNHFYQSLIKKRIVMLNKNQSKKRNYWKYYAVIPALVAFVLLFQIQTIAQERKKAEKEISNKDIKSVDIYKINKNSTDQELKEFAEKLKQNHNVEILISEVKRNSKNELTSIKVDVNKGTGEDQTIQIESDKAIKSCGIVIVIDKKGNKKVNIITDDDQFQIAGLDEENQEAEDVNADLAIQTPPIAPTPPTFPTGPMPTPPIVDVSKIITAPIPPTNHNDKVAMKKFEKEMVEFEKKMEAYEPDMSAYEKEVEEVMEKRSAIYDKEMEKYDIAMEKFNADMEKYTQYVEQKYGKDMKQYEIHMKEYEKNMKQYEKEMKLHEKKMEKKNRRS